jgi:hypothetical protein
MSLTKEEILVTLAATKEVATNNWDQNTKIQFIFNALQNVMNRSSSYSVEEEVDKKLLKELYDLALKRNKEVALYLEENFHEEIENEMSLITLCDMKKNGQELPEIVNDNKELITFIDIMHELEACNESSPLHFLLDLKNYKDYRINQTTPWEPPKIHSFCFSDVILQILNKEAGEQVLQGHHFPIIEAMVEYINKNNSCDDLSKPIIEGDKYKFCKYLLRAIKEADKNFLEEYVHLSKKAVKHQAWKCLAVITSHLDSEKEMEKIEDAILNKAEYILDVRYPPVKPKETDVEGLRALANVKNNLDMSDENFQWLIRLVPSYDSLYEQVNKELIESRPNTVTPVTPTTS